MTEDSRNSDDSEAKLIPAKGKGSFWISKMAISVLLTEKATATEICAFLVLSRYTDESGCFCTAGTQAIFRAIGVGHVVVGKALERLQRYRLGASRKNPQFIICSAEHWASTTGKSLPHGPVARSQVRWVLNNFDTNPEDRIWFSNNLVDGIGKFTNPLKRLKRCGDVAARVLLVLYREHDLDQFGGARPSGCCAVKYTMNKVINDIANGMYDMWHGEYDGPYVWHPTSLHVLGINAFPKDNDEKSKALKPLFSAIDSLDSAGFIYQVVTAMDRQAGDDEAQVIYELDCKSRHGYKPQGESGLGGETARMSGRFDKSVADSMGRLRGVYAALVPAGVTVFIVGVFRVRFRVSNPKNHGVKGSWARIYGGQREGKEWIDDVNQRYGFNHEPARPEMPTETDDTSYGDGVPF
jgi:hypothetical protein